MLYLDTSAAVKIIVTEPETDQLREWLRHHGGRSTYISTALLRTELMRAVGFAVAYGTIDHRQAESHRTSVRRLIAGTRLVRLTDEILDRAGAVSPLLSRSLDALHLVTALALAGQLTAFVTYDHRLGDAASEAGLPVVSPGT